MDLPEKKGYRCSDCERTAIVSGKGEKPPECCGKRMAEVPLSECTKDPSWAEHARFDDNDEPCDTGQKV